MGAQENRGRGGEVREAGGMDPPVSRLYVISWWHRSHTTKLICNLGPVYMEMGDPR